MKTLGITGTRKSLTIKQVKELKELLINFYETEDFKWLVTGMCSGADETANNMARDLGYKTIGRPGSTNQANSFKVDIEYDAKPFMVRNQDIIDECEILIGLPNTESELLRSGTWATLRKAKKQSKKLIIIYPSGRIETNF